MQQLLSGSSFNEQIQENLNKSDFCISIDLSIFSASEFASESSISLAIASNVRLMKLR
jgi:peroxiredoxin